MRKKQVADVVVIGGGTAGVFAAISAAKNGVRTLLVEKNSMLGGTVTVAGVNFPGLFFAWGKQVIAGPCWEAVKRAERLGGAKIPKISYQPERHWHEQIPLNRFVYTYVLNEMCRESGVTALTNAMISRAEEKEDCLKMMITDKHGLFEVEAKVAIDATGDGNLARIMGYPCEKSEVQQPATLQNQLSGYDAASVHVPEIQKWMDANKDLVLPPELTAGLLKHFLNIHKLDIHIPCLDADTSEGRSELEYRTLSTMMAVYKFLKRIPALEHLSVDFIAEETGVRESCRIKGEKTVTAEDYMKGTLYPDSVCYAFYPIDLHVMDGLENDFLQDGIVPKIPYGALVPKGSKRLLCAGRCISSDVYANSALRVQAPCMAMGQAAGCAAALAAANDIEVYDVSYEELCTLLRNLGAIVPES